MKWEAPSFVVIKMDAEIGAYQEDGFTDFSEAMEQPVHVVLPPATTRPASAT